MCPIVAFAFNSCGWSVDTANREAVFTEDSSPTTKVPDSDGGASFTWQDINSHVMCTLPVTVNSSEVWLCACKIIYSLTPVSFWYWFVLVSLTESVVSIDLAVLLVTVSCTFLPMWFHPLPWTDVTLHFLPRHSQMHPFKPTCLLPTKPINLKHKFTFNFKLFFDIFIQSANNFHSHLRKTYNATNQLILGKSM